ncbi:VWA domain-containing protein [Streptomyces sp. SID1121]|uniref:VWA domain-containing protein n=1 Tax=Streptomyces sp. SID1121 TaxID=3425888 RepID=UPI0040575AD6
MLRGGQVTPAEDRSPLGLSFALEVDASSDVAFDDERMDALLTIRARTSARAPAVAPIAEVLIMDKSLSMAGQGKLNEAKRAMCAAVDALQDGTYLGIVAGHHEAEVIFPATGGLARIDATARAAAKNRILDQLPEGGTAIGKWLACADRLFATVTARSTVRHAVLYTDGKDEHETPEELGSALAACADRFVCDARGLGGDWYYAELLRITEALHGTAEAVVTVSDLTGDFTRLMEQARRIVVPRVYLGLRLNDRFRLGFVRQTLPVQAHLTSQQQRRDDEIHVPLGSWPPEDRQYLVSLRFDPATLRVGEELRAARITLRAERDDGTREPCADPEALVVVRRATPDFPVRIPESHTRAENVYELGLAMRACADAHEAGRYEQADRELRTALELAEALGDFAKLELLRSVTVTGPDDRPRLNRSAPRAAMQRIGLRSTATRVPGADPVHPPPDGDPLRRRCRRCGTTTMARRLRHCEECGYEFGSGTDDHGGGRGGGPGGDPDGGPVGDDPDGGDPGGGHGGGPGGGPGGGGPDGGGRGGAGRGGGPDRNGPGGGTPVDAL